MVLITETFYGVSGTSRNTTNYPRTSILNDGGCHLVGSEVFASSANAGQIEYKTVRKNLI